MLTSMGILAQRFPGEDFSGRGGSGPMVADTVKKPPLSLKYYQIRDIGYTVLTADTLATRPPFADLQNDDIHHQRLGNMFSATLPVRFNRPVSPGNKIGIKSYHIYDRHFRSGYIPSPNRPLATAQYATRFNDGHNNIGIDFNRTFARDITFGIHLFAGKSEGQFQNQRSNYNRLEFNLVQESNTRKRASYAHFSIYRNGEEMNGGLSDPSSINQPVVGGNASRPVNSSDAAMRLKNTNVKIGTILRLGVDTIPVKVKKSVFVEVGSFSNTFGYQESSLSTSDKERYTPLRLTGDLLDAKIQNRNLFEKIGLRLLSDKFEFSGGLRILHNSVLQDTLSEVKRTQIFINSVGNYKVNRSTSLSFNIYQEAAANPENKYAVDLRHRIKQHRFKLSAYIASDRPGIVQSKLAFDGEIQWENSFNNENALAASLNYTNEKTASYGTISYIQIKNLVYQSRFGNYSQFNGAFKVYSAELRQRFSVFNITLDNTIYVQSISNEEIISLPKLSSRHDFNTRLNFFKKRLRTRFGVVVWLQDSSTLPSFHPIINDFYFPDVTKTARYIRVMPYLRARIDSLEFFIATDDLINQSLNRHHFSVSGYAEPDTRINLGFRWRLLD